MLKNIPSILSPELLKVLCEMGHGDRICIGDGNFPGQSIAHKNNLVMVRADGHGVCELLDAILTVMPLDMHVEHPAMLMQKADRDKDLDITIWKQFEEIIARHDTRGASALGFYERFDYYAEAAKCYCILATGETAIYANIMLQKGVVVNG